jgi:hypothetical protein
VEEGLRECSAAVKAAHCSWQAEAVEAEEQRALNEMASVRLWAAGVAAARQKEWVSLDWEAEEEQDHDSAEGEVLKISDRL